RVSEMVWPLVARISRSVATVTELKVSSVTIRDPGSGSRTGASSASTAGAAGALGAGLLGCRADFRTGLGVVTSIGGSSVAACWPIAEYETVVSVSAGNTLTAALRQLCLDKAIRNPHFRML